ncbi:MAG: hypothetical protein ACTSQY_00835 [Candidatus Odinarchaeia archaeon]
MIIQIYKMISTLRDKLINESYESTDFDTIDRIKTLLEIGLKQCQYCIKLSKAKENVRIEELDCNIMHRFLYDDCDKFELDKRKLIEW